jgi:hypothetical protein
MLWPLFYIYVGICLAMMAPAIWRKEDRLQFPFLAGGTVLLMVCLPLAGLISDPSGPPAASIGRFIVMAILCQLASWAGYNYSWKSKTFSNYQFDRSRLAISAVILSVFGFYFAYQLSTTVPEIAENGNWTGIATIFSMLSQVSRYGFVLAAILYFKSKDWRFFLVMIPQIAIYGKQFLAGRRSPTGELLIITMTLFFFYRKRSVPLWLLLTGMGFLAVFSYNIGDIRANADRPLEERIESFMSSDPLSALSEESMIEDKRYVEIFNAVNFMEAKDLGGNYTYGLHFWNQLVFGFVPAQFVGDAFKKSLQFNLDDDTALTRFEKASGTCESGIAEAFMAFGYFGCALFFIMGASFRWLWDQSVRGSVSCQLVLMLNILPAIMSYSSQLWSMLNGLVSLLAFAGPFLWWSAIAIPTGWQLGNGEKSVASSPETVR